MALNQGTTARTHDCSKVTIARRCEYRGGELAWKDLILRVICPAFCLHTADTKIRIKCIALRVRVSKTRPRF